MEITGGIPTDLFDLESAWPVKVSVETALVRLTLSGMLQWKEELQSDLTVRLSGDRLEDLSAILGTNLPHLGPYVLDGRLALSAKQIGLSDLAGTVGKTSFSGKLLLRFLTNKPVLSGNLSFDTLDLDPLRMTSGNTDEKEAEKSTVPDSAENRLPFDFFHLLDTNLVLEAQNITGVPGDLRDVELDISLANGNLKALLKLNLAGTNINGNINVAAGHQETALSLSLNTEKADLKQALAILAGSTPSTDGSLGAIALTASTEGATARDLFDRVDMRVQVAPSQVNFRVKAEQHPVVINLHDLSLIRGAKGKMNLQAGGTVLGEKFNFHLATGNPAHYLDNRKLPVTVLFNGGGANLHIDGILNPKQEQDKARLKVSLDGRRIGDLAAWTGLSGDAEMDYKVAGMFHYHGESLRLVLDTIRVGQVEVAGELAYKELKSTSPVFDIRVSAETLDVGQLQELQALIKEAEIVAEEEALNLEDLSWDMDILPDDFKFKDGNIHLVVKKINMGSAKITDVGFGAGFKDGKMTASPFQATVGDETFKGEVALDFDSKIPSARFTLSTDHVDIPKLLQQFQITSPIDATAAHFGVEFTLRGKHAIDILKLSEVMVRIEDGTWRVAHLGGLGETEIKVSEALYTTSPDKPALLHVEGHLGEIPIAINMTENGMFTHDLSQPFFLSLDVKIAETDLKAEAHLTLQEIIQSDFHLRLSLSGDRMDTLNPLFGLNLPPLGPYEMSGNYHATPTITTLKDMLVRVGESRLKGEIRAEGKKLPVHVDSKFTADSIQLNDFRLESWSPFQDIKQRFTAQTVKIKAGSTDADTRKNVRDKEVDNTGEELKSLLNPQIVKHVDGRLSVEVKEVLSGKDKLGSGLLTARLKDGRFMVDPLRIDIPGGSLEITAGIKVSENETDAEITMKIEHLDYGVLARRLAPQSAMKGWLYLDVDLRSRAENPKDLMQSASGHFDFGVTPERLDAGVFDLWAANIVTSILPLLTHKEESEVNCLAARFDMQNGIMKHKEILLDTTKVQVHGRGEVNFLDQKVHLRLLPHPKKPQFFNLATPLVINGTFSDFHVGVNTGDILGSVVRFITSTITVPFQWLIYHKLPADGLEACSQALQREKDK